MQRAPHEGGIDAGVGESVQLRGISDTAAGHQLDAGERPAHGADERKIDSGAGAHAGEVEDDDRGHAGAGGEPGELQWGEGAERRVRRVRLTGTQVERKYRAIGRIYSTHQPRERLTRILGGREGLEPDDHTLGAVVHELARPVGGGDARVHPGGHSRPSLRDRAAKRALRGASHYGIEVGEVQLGVAQLVPECPVPESRAWRRTAREGCRAQSGCRVEENGCRIQNISGSEMPHRMIGWDVGGVNTKVARVEGGMVREIRSVPFEIQRAPGELTPLIARLAHEVGSEPGDHHAVTMTAELSQCFLTKREGVGFVLDAFERALPDRAILVYGTDGEFRSVTDARQLPLLSAASNWAATAAVVAQQWPDAVLVDIGTTTTDPNACRSDRPRGATRR